MRVLAIFCAAFAAGVALSQYLLSAQWALILCGVFAAAALVMGLCGCANKRGDWAKRAFLCALGLCFAFEDNTLYAHFIKSPNGGTDENGCFFMFLQLLCIVHQNLCEI